MDDENLARRLAAILAADVVGYSRLMSADEVGTLRTLKAHRHQFIDPVIARHHGRIVKTTGDGLLVEFASALDAVGCALAFQRGMAWRNAGVAEGDRIIFRIGINVGDILVVDDDIFGDGVNIAARLEAICEPGGICISRTVNDQIAGKMPLGFASRGEHMVKNIPHAISLFGMAADDIAALPEPEPASPAARAPRLSIVVLPFRNLSDDPDQEYFVDGLVDNLTTDLTAHIHDLFVIARDSAFTYKGNAIDVKKVGRELGVRFVLQGSVQRRGDQLRVNAHLVDAESGAQLWAERFDDDRADLFALQDRIAARLANAIGVTIVAASAREAERRNANANAADLVLRARALIYRPQSPANLDAAAALCRRALALDPLDRDAMGGLAMVIALRIVNHGSVLRLSSEEQREQAREASRLIDQVLSAEPDRAGAHNTRGLLLDHARRHREAAQEYKIAIALDANATYARGNLACSMICLGEPEEVFGLIAENMRRSPRDYNLGLWHGTQGAAHLLLGRYAHAIEDLVIARNATPVSLDDAVNLVAAIAMHGDAAAAARELPIAMKIEPRLTIAWLKANPLHSDDPGYTHLAEATLYEGLRRAGVPER